MHASVRVSLPSRPSPVALILTEITSYPIHPVHAVNRAERKRSADYCTLFVFFCRSLSEAVELGLYTDCELAQSSPTNMHRLPSRRALVCASSRRHIAAAWLERSHCSLSSPVAAHSSLLSFCSVSARVHLHEGVCSPRKVRIE